MKNVISFQCKAWKDKQKFGTQWNEFDFLKSGTERERNAFHFGICWNGTERFPDFGFENGTERFPFEMERSAPLNVTIPLLIVLDLNSLGLKVVSASKGNSRHDPTW